MPAPRKIVDGRVPFLSEWQLEAEAQRLVEAFGRAYGPVTRPLIPVEDILERYLRFGLDFDDLPRVLG